MTAYLVGAGPGDHGLLTLRAAELIATADVILYDRLIPPDALAGARADAELVFVGKEGGGEQVPQADTNALLLRHAATGRTVVRLKGGDPFVFGRGGEEALVLREAGIPFEVVPGITAGIAAPAYAGVPVTQRNVASAVAFVTGHENPDKPETQLDWPALAAFPGTLVFYMGVRALDRIATQLVTGGRSPETPVAIVERGTMPSQRTTLATLSTVAERARERGVRAPAVTVVGDVAAFGDELAWLEARPLHGVRVAVTRARAQASPMAARLRALGAEVVEAPAIRTRTLPDVELPILAGHDLVVVTSPNGAHELFALLERSGLDARALAGHRVAAIGPGTARGAARVRDRRRSRPAAGRGRGPRRGARGRAGVQGADRPRARGPGRAPGRAARARLRGHRPPPLRDDRRAAGRRDARGRRGRGLDHVHVRLDRPLPRRGRGRRPAGRTAAGVDRAGDVGGAARARARAGPGGRPAHARRARRGARQLWLTRPSSSTTVDDMETATSTPASPEDALAAVVALRKLADRVEDDAVRRAIRAGWPWAEVAEALGVTKQAVHKKHAKRIGGGG